MLTKAFRNANQGVLLYELSQAYLWRYAQANVLEEGEQEHVWCVPIMFALFKDAFFEIQQLNVANMVCFLKRMMEKKLMSRSCKKWINMQKREGGMYKYPKQRL